MPGGQFQQKKVQLVQIIEQNIFLLAILIPARQKNLHQNTDIVIMKSHSPLLLIPSPQIPI